MGTCQHRPRPAVCAEDVRAEDQERHSLPKAEAARRLGCSCCKFKSQAPGGHGDPFPPLTLPRLTQPWTPGIAALLAVLFALTLLLLGESCPGRGWVFPFGASHVSSRHRWRPMTTFLRTPRRDKQSFSGCFKVPCLWLLTDHRVHLCFPSSQGADVLGGRTVLLVALGRCRWLLLPIRGQFSRYQPCDVRDRGPCGRTSPRQPAQCPCVSVVFRGSRDARARGRPAGHQAPSGRLSLCSRRSDSGVSFVPSLSSWTLLPAQTCRPAPPVRFLIPGGLSSLQWLQNSYLAPFRVSLLILSRHSRIAS